MAADGDHVTDDGRTADGWAHTITEKFLGLGQKCFVTIE